jgi:tryptophan synthase alpha chain
MSYISAHIEKINKLNRKVLSIFITAGFPVKKNFVGLMEDLLQAGADLLELGIPFSDPIADGPVIQQSSQIALNNGMNLATIFSYCEQIKKLTKKPLILMGYSNPLIKYGLGNFINNAYNSGVDGLIIPDVPLEEYGKFWGESNPPMDIIMLTTPTSSEDRIRRIDSLSSGFVYCVSVTGTTGITDTFNSETIINLDRTYNLVDKNKMLIGFGISKPDDIVKFSPYCDGIIVGSAIIRSLLGEKEKDYRKTINFVKTLSTSCQMK